MNLFKKLFLGCAASAMLLGTACSTASKAPQTVNKTNYPEEKLGWKLGAQAYTFRLFTFAEALDKIDAAGLRFVEAFPGQKIGAGSEEKMTYELSKEGRELVKKLLKDKKITLHAYGVVGAKSAEEWDKVFAFAKDMGVKVINCEPEENMLDVVSTLADKYDMLVGIHNHPTPSRYWNPDVVLEALKGRSKRMGATADVGHWMRSGLDPITCLKKLEGKIIHLHFKDLNEFGNKKAHDVPWGTGKLGLKEVQAELKRQKFKGMFSAEYEYNWESSLPEVTQSAQNFRNAL